MSSLKMLYSFLLAAAIALLALTAPHAAGAVGPQTYNEQFPIGYRINNVCSAGGPEEIIHLSGTLHVTYTSVEDGSGGYHVTSHANWQGVEGVNEATGEKFRVISAGKSTFNTNGGPPFTSTSTVHNNLVGQGSGVILIMQNTYHITVNAGGEVISQFVHQSAECKD